MHETNEEILNELRIEVAKQKENIDSLKTSVNKLEKQLNEFISTVKNGYIDERVIKVLKQEDKLMDEIIREKRLRSDQILYLLINSIIDIAEKSDVDSDYVEILKRIRDENYSKLKNKGGSKLIDKE